MSVQKVNGNKFLVRKTRMHRSFGPPSDDVHEGPHLQWDEDWAVVCIKVLLVVQQYLALLFVSLAVFDEVFHCLTIIIIGHQFEIRGRVECLEWFLEREVFLCRVDERLKPRISDDSRFHSIVSHGAQKGGRSAKTVTGHNKFEQVKLYCLWKT